MVELTQYDDKGLVSIASNSVASFERFVYHDAKTLIYLKLQSGDDPLSFHVKEEYDDVKRLFAKDDWERSNGRC